MREENVVNNFKKYYNENPTDLFSSSGRIELLGNHTDHNHGDVLVGAVNLDLLASCQKTCDYIISIYSEGYGESVVDIMNLEKNSSENGTNKALIKGCVYKMKELGYKVGGFKAYVNSILPAGSGISSSAAYECLIIEILNYYYNNDNMPRFDIAKIGQFAESEYFNKPCGLLDQCGVSFGGINKISFKDINNPVVTHLEYDFKGYDLILVNTGGDHSNLTADYASIPSEMKSVANFFGKYYLSEVDESLFYENISKLREVVSDRAILRAIHFYNENKVVEKGFEAIKNDDLSLFLAQIQNSGDSSYKYLQNTWNNKNTKQNINLALALASHYIQDGACRVHGGGFEGTILCFVSINETTEFIKNMSKVFTDKNVHKISVRNEGSHHIKNI